MHIAHAQTLFVHIFGQVFRHFFRQRGHQCPLAGCAGRATLGDQIINLAGGRANLASRVNKPRRSNDLLDENAARAIHLPATRRCRDMHCLGTHNVPFFKFHGPVVDTAWQPEAELGQGRFAAEVAAKHATDLRHRYMAFISENQRIVGQIFKQCGRRLAGLASCQIARIILNSRAASGGFQHFNVEQGALFQTLGFEQPPCRFKLFKPQFQFVLNMQHGLFQCRPRGHVM